MSGTRLSPRDDPAGVMFPRSVSVIAMIMLDASRKPSWRGSLQRFFPRQWQGLMFQTFIGDHIRRHCGHVYIFMCTKTIGMMTKVQIVMQPDVHFFN